MKYIVMCVVLSWVSVAQAEIYRWVDENGKVHFGDDPPATQQVDVMTPEIVTFESVTYDNVDLGEASDRKQVIMYATSWCGYCKQARQYFQSKRIPYTEYDIEKNAQAKRMYDLLGGKGVPVILVGKKRLNGFSASGFERIYR